MNLKSLIKKYEDKRKFIDSAGAREMYGPYATEDNLHIVDEFLKDLKELKEVIK